MINFMRCKVVFLALALLTLNAGCGGSPKAADTLPAPEGKASLFAYVGAGLKEPVSELARQYEQKTGVKVEMTFNNSGALLSQLETMNKGDIYMPGGMPYVEQAGKKGFVDKVVGPVAYHVPVIAVSKGNPRKIEKIQDLARPGLKLVLPEKDATALGNSAFAMFDKLGISKDIEKNVLTYVETAPKVPATLMMGQGDAGIAEYSNISRNLDKLDLIEIDPSINKVEEIPCATLKCSTRKEEAEKFLEFVKTEGPAVFDKYGFKTKA